MRLSRPICLLGVRQARCRDRAGFPTGQNGLGRCDLRPARTWARTVSQHVLPVSLERLDSELRWNHDPVKPLSRQKQKEVAMSMSDFTIAMTVTATIFAALMLAAAL